MAALALVIYVVWFVLAFGWRSYVQYRRTGDIGLRLAATPGTAQWWAKLGFVVALVVGVLAPVAAVVGLDDLVALHATRLQATGTAIAVVGVALTAIAQLAMGDSWRIGVDPGERTDLVMAGPFQVVRNPIFSAMLVTAVGLTAMVPNAIAVVGLGALVTALELQVRLVEEPYLTSVHGDGYRRYASQVGRFVPGVGRLA